MDWSAHHEWISPDGVLPLNALNRSGVNYWFLQVIIMATLDSSGDVRSAAGHAAFSMKGTDDRWVMIQVSTFTNWVNEQLKNLDLSVKDLSTDFCDGIKLCSLMEVLQEQRIGRVIRKPINQHHYLENVSLALKAITKDNIKLVNIGEFWRKSSMATSQSSKEGMVIRCIWILIQPLVASYEKSVKL